MVEKPKAENFTVGQRVVCADPTRFMKEKCRYLTNREGVVERVWPSTGDPKTAMRINEVSVRWGKRNGRGKEQIMRMRPDYLQPIQD